MLSTTFVAAADTSVASSLYFFSRCSKYSDLYNAEVIFSDFTNFMLFNLGISVGKFSFISYDSCVTL